jgi:hypothetical protein
MGLMASSKKRKYRKLQIKPDAYRVGETATPERAAKLGGIVERPLAYANNGQIVHRRQEARVECTLDAYRFRSMISDEQHQAGMMFRTAYMNAARSKGVVDLSAIRVDNRKPVDPNQPPDVWGRKTLKEAQEAMSIEQYAVVETVAGWDALAGNSRRLTMLRYGLDELYRMWF